MGTPHCIRTTESSLPYYYEKDAFGFQALIPPCPRRAPRKHEIFQVFVFRRAGDSACRLGEGYGSLHIQGKAKETVVKSSLGLGGGVAAPTKNHFIIRNSVFNIRNSILFSY